MRLIASCIADYRSSFSLLERRTRGATLNTAVRSLKHSALRGQAHDCRLAELKNNRHGKRRVLPCLGAPYNGVREESDPNYALRSLLNNLYAIWRSAGDTRAAVDASILVLSVLFTGTVYYDPVHLRTVIGPEPFARYHPCS